MVHSLLRRITVATSKACPRPPSRTLKVFSFLPLSQIWYSPPSRTLRLFSFLPFSQNWYEQINRDIIIWASKLFSDVEFFLSFYHFHFHNQISCFVTTFPVHTLNVCRVLKKYKPLGDFISLFQCFIIFSNPNFTFLFRCWYAGVTCVWGPQGITHHRPCHCEITPLLWNYSFEWLGNYHSNI